MIYNATGMEYVSMGFVVVIKAAENFLYFIIVEKRFLFAFLLLLNLVIITSTKLFMTIKTK